MKSNRKKGKRPVSHEKAWSGTFILAKFELSLIHVRELLFQVSCTIDMFLQCSKEMHP